MGGWDRFSEWVATLVVAAMTWTSGVLAPQPPHDAVSTADPVPAAMQAWAIALPAQLDSPQIEPQTDDVETLDEGAPPTATSTTTDQSGTSAPIEATGDQDIELLDQGTPPPTQVTTSEPVAVTSEPAPVSSEPAPVAAAPMSAETTSAAPVASGPVLPPGFGTGRVQVAAGNNGFPTGLANCHVGAVTGRAYVGIDCGDTDDAFVGHAASFTDFPFVVEAPFPFNDSNEPAGTTSTVDDNPSANDQFVLNNTGADSFFVRDPRVPNVETNGSSGSVVSLAQKSGEHPRDRIEQQGSHKARSQHGGSSTKAQRADDSNTDVGSASKDSKQKHHKSEKKKDKSKEKNKKEDKKDSKDKKKKDKNGQNRKSDKDENK